MITGHTKVYGVIGNPIEHTFSPFIHNMLAEETGIDMVYASFHVKDGQLENAVKGLDGLNIQGINVTIPYKLEIMQYMDEVTTVAQNVGAMNTVVRDGDRWIGYNTDVFGLKMSLEREGVNLEGQSILIIGAGGAARAIAVMCAEAGAKSIVIMNRTAHKAEELAHFIRQRYEMDTLVIEREDLEGDKLLLQEISIGIQTTSVGMSPKIDGNPLGDSKFYDQLKVAVDLIYNPGETQFLAKARAAGALTVNGLGMLYFQALMAFELWSGEKVAEPIVEKCYRAFSEKMRVIKDV